SKQVVIWIGPEGDWSKDEIDLASISDYTFTGLGPRRLRAETAAIHAVGLVSALLQDPV
ncbi:RNA methyltransferase, partial [bacterium]|nr:RNA methyltransferase [bacterium]